MPSRSSTTSRATADLDSALTAYREERNLEVLKLQSAARNRMEWFENVARYARLPPEQFAYSLLTGSQRIGHENLKTARSAVRQRATKRWLAQRAGAEDARPPMFLPFKLRGLELDESRRRLARWRSTAPSTACRTTGTSCTTGIAPWAAPGLLFTEMTCVSPEGRITPGCTGLWNEAQRDALATHRRVRARDPPAKICLQLGHSGRKGSTQLGWEEGGPSARQRQLARVWRPRPCRISKASARRPRAMTRADMDRVRARVRARDAARRASRLRHARAAHGARLPARLLPLAAHEPAHGRIRRRHSRPAALPARGARRRARGSGRRTGRCPCASRRRLGRGRPARRTICSRSRGRFKAAGVDLIDVSSGQTVPWQKPVYGRMWQTPFSDNVRNDIGIATMAVGNIYEADHVNSIIASGRADLCALARPHLADPAWTLEAAARQGYQRAVVAAAVPVRQEPARAQSAARGASQRSSLSMSANQQSLAGRHAVVTGAGRGIGAAIAVSAGRRRARACRCSARDEAKLAELAEKLGGAKRATAGHGGCHATPTSVRAAFTAARERFGPAAHSGQQRRARPQARSSRTPTRRSGTASWR